MCILVQIKELMSITVQIYSERVKTGGLGKVFLSTFFAQLMWVVESFLASFVNKAPFLSYSVVFRSRTCFLYARQNKMFDWWVHVFSFRFVTGPKCQKRKEQIILDFRKPIFLQQQAWILAIKDSSITSRLKEDQFRRLLDFELCVGILIVQKSQQLILQSM